MKRLRKKRDEETHEQHPHRGEADYQEEDLHDARREEEMNGASRCFW